MKELEQIQTIRIPRRDLLRFAGIGAVLAACGQATPEPTSSPLIASSTPTSSPTESPRPSPTGTPMGDVREPTPTQDPAAATGAEGSANGTTGNGTELTLRRFESVEQAASVYGADSWSRNPRNWRINEFGSPWLTPRTDGVTTRVNVAGAVLDTWLSIRTEVNPHNAIGFVIHGIPQMDIQGGTFWQFVNPDAGQPHVFGQLTERERIEQPGTLVVPVCPPERTGVTLGVDNLMRIDSVRTAAIRFGLDSHSRNPRNWKINEFGSPWLPAKRDGSTTRVRLDGAVLDSWLSIKSEVNPWNALGMAVNPNSVDIMDITGGTFWLFRDREAGFGQIFTQLTARELIEQPGTLVIPVTECPVVCPPGFPPSKGGPAPTPSPDAK